MFKKLVFRLPITTAYAHCDVPCGIYDPTMARVAAATVVRMVEKIEALPKENPTVEDRNNFVRMVVTKEDHAQKCKDELLILWADFFKEEHLKLFPDLHDTFWKAEKLCSENKQHVSMEKAQELKDQVEKIAEMFFKVKNSQTK